LGSSFPTPSDKTKTKCQSTQDTQDTQDTQTHRHTDTQTHRHTATKNSFTVNAPDNEPPS